MHFFHIISCSLIVLSHFYKHWYNKRRIQIAERAEFKCLSPTCWTVRTINIAFLTSNFRFDFFRFSTLYVHRKHVESTFHAESLKPSISFHQLRFPCIQKLLAVEAMTERKQMADADGLKASIFKAIKNVQVSAARIVPPLYKGKATVFARWIRISFQKCGFLSFLHPLAKWETFAVRRI